MGRNVERVVVAMSGGVDSSTAAALLKERGHEVIGISLLLAPNGGTAGPCCGSRGIEDARRVAGRLGIAFYALDLRREFRRSVIEPFCRAYGQGLTPNPCVTCNQRIKFGALLEKARGLGAGYLATGHYVTVEREGTSGRYALGMGADGDDQSYFLYSLSQRQLRHALFPLGTFSKDQVRRMARDFGLPVHDKPGSQDLCFVSRGDYRGLLRAEQPDAFRPGPIVHVSGRVLGEHPGLAAYTVGQRHGLGIAHPEPLYVVALRPADNAVIVGEREHILRRRVRVGRVNWIACPPRERLELRVKIRYNHMGVEAMVTPLDGGALVEFAEPQEAPCPGQAAVFYAGRRVIGGGTIEPDAPN